MTHTPKPQRPLTLPERQLLVFLAEYLARVTPLGMEPSVGDCLQPMGSVFDAGVEALTGLGIYEEGEIPGVFRILIEPEAIRAHLETRPLARRNFERTLHAFLVHAAGHTEALPVTRAPFMLPQPFAQIGAVLLRLGYLDSVGERVQWTNKAAPLMQEAILWDDRGQCLSEIWQAQEEAEARHFFAGLPNSLRESLRRTVIERGGFEGLDLLRHHWTGRGWSEIRQEKPGDLSQASFRVNFFTTFIRLIREGRG